MKYGIPRKNNEFLDVTGTFKQPQTKGFETFKIAVKDPLIVAKLQFVSFVASRLMSYIKSYQTIKPLTRFLNKDLEQMCRSLLQVIIKSEILEKCKDSYELLEIDFTDGNNHLEKKEMYVGFTERYLKKRSWNSKRYQQI